MSWQIFDKSGNWLGSCNIAPDMDDLAARGEIAIEYTQTGSGKLVLDGDAVVEHPPQPSKFHVWTGGDWILDESGLFAQLEAVRAAKYSEINTAAQAYIATEAELDKVPEFEVKTWSQQASEAEAWAIDPATATPVLAQIAAARGCDLDDLRRKALRKARLYSALTASVAGQRQKFVDLLNLAVTLEDIAAINPIYEYEAAK